MSGTVNYLAGLSAEDGVARHAESLGRCVLERRWRGKRGEIDLIVQDGDVRVFVEVKKSRDFATAAARLGSAQIKRLFQTAEEYLATIPNGAFLDVRFDVALVDGSGQIELVENALCA